MRRLVDLIFLANRENKPSFSPDDVVDGVPLVDIVIYTTTIAAVLSKYCLNEPDGIDMVRADVKLLQSYF
jgi:hypothetical protein